MAEPSERDRERALLIVTASDLYGAAVRELAAARDEGRREERERQRWRSVDTDPPAPARMVLLYWPYWAGSDPVSGYLEHSGTWNSLVALSLDGPPPTHWMPLPEPPDA